MNEAPQHQIQDPIDQALCADIAAYLRSIDKYFPDFDQLPDVKAVRKLTARFICDLENKYPGTAVTAGMMLAMYDLHGHLIEDEQPIELDCWAQPLPKETKENEMSNKATEKLMQALSLMKCLRLNKNALQPTGLKALEGIECLLLQAYKESQGPVQIRDRDEIIRRLYEMTSLNTDPLWAGLDVYDYCTDSSGMGDVGADRELMEKAKATFDDVLNQFHSEAADPYLVLWGMARSMKEFMAQTEGVSLSKTEPEEPKKVDPVDFLGDGDIEF